MALIGSIRKHFWFVLIIIGLALAAFVIMDMVGAGNRGGMAGQFNIGKVNGQSLDYRDFQQAESSLYSGSGDIYGAKAAVWDYMVEKAIIADEAETNGLAVPTEELKNLLFGSNPAPIVRQMYTDPNTGQFNRSALLEVKQAIEGGQLLNPSFEARWAEIEKQVRTEKLKEKMGTAVAKGLYTPTWMVQQRQSYANQMVSFNYVKVPFDFIEEDLTITDEDVESFIAGKEDQYTKDKETRMIRYAVMDVLPTAADTALRKETIMEYIQEFKVTENDSIYAINHDGFYSPYYNKTEDLPEVIRDVMPTIEVGDVYGPYEDQGSFFAIKLKDKANIPDSVEARHILRSTVVTQGGSSVEDARAFIDSLKTLLETGVATFDSLAIKHSQDPGSSFNGGELGSFTQGRMLPEFNEACFKGGREGGLYVVTTQVGVHLIEVQDVVFNDTEDDYQVAFITNAITPSDETQNDLEGEMSELITSYRTLAELEEAISGRTDITIETEGPFELNDYNITGLGVDQTSRDIIRWAFEETTSQGDISPELYTFTDNINYFDSKYVIAGLEEIIPPGLPTTEALKLQLSTEINRQKKGQQIASQISGSDLNAIASNFSTEIDSVGNALFTTTSLPGMGNEPKVLSKALSMNDGEVSSPIVGNNGVYVVKVTKKESANTSSNIPFERRTLTMAARSQSTLKLMDALKEIADIEDSRSRFF